MSHGIVFGYGYDHLCSTYGVGNRTGTGSERNVVVRMNLREKRTVVSYLTDNKYICNLAKKIYFLHITLYFWHIPKYIVYL